MLFFIHDQVLQDKVMIKHCPTYTMHADFFTKPLQGMLFYRLRDLIMNIARESPYHSSHRSVLKDNVMNITTTQHKKQKPHRVLVPLHARQVCHLTLLIIVLEIGCRVIYTPNQHHHITRINLR